VEGRKKAEGAVMGKARRGRQRGKRQGGNEGQRHKGAKAQSSML